MSSHPEFLIEHNHTLDVRCEHHVPSKNRQCKNRGCYIVTGCVFEHRNGIYCFQHAKVVERRHNACLAQGTPFSEYVKKMDFTEVMDSLIESAFNKARFGGGVVLPGIEKAAHISIHKELGE